MRTLLIAIRVTQALFAVGFYFQVPAVTNLWVFPGTTPLTFILAAAAASTLWVVFSKQWAALTGIALDYVMILTPLGIYSWQIGSQSSDSPLIIYAITCLVTALFGVGMLWWSR